MNIKTAIKDKIPYSFLGILQKIKMFGYSNGITKGKHCYIDKSAQFIGKSCIQLGNNVCIGMDVNININGPRNDKIKRLIIGSNSYVGRDSFISTGKLITLGEFFLGGPHCSIIGQNHDVSNPLKSYLVGEAELTKTIVIEDNVWIGDGVTVVGNLTIGRGSIIGAKSLVTNKMSA